MDAKPSGDKKSMVTPRPFAARASEANVRTTPFTCGCQASVATRTRIRCSAVATDQLSDWRIALRQYGKFISQSCDALYAALGDSRHPVTQVLCASGRLAPRIIWPRWKHRHHQCPRRRAESHAQFADASAGAGY